MKIQFLGAAQTVTGSKFLLQSETTKILLDCGLFQGLKDLRLKNWAPFPFAPNDLDAIVLSHAHIDHSGLIPRIVSQGFRKKIYCTPGTQDLCEILLRDSGFLQEEDAHYANKKGFSKHHPAQPLYTEQEAVQAMHYFQSQKMAVPFQIGDFKITFSPAGHILDAACILIENEESKILFSGDLGRSNDLIISSPTPPPSCHTLLMESTYGDRLHSPEHPLKEIKKIIEEIVQRKGILLLPAFAVGRTQLLVYCIHEVFSQNKNLRIPLYVNSPMAMKVSKLYYRYHKGHRLSEKQTREMFQGARFVQSVEESKELNHQKGPLIIIASSGMMTGGRILHHMKTFGPDPKNMIVLAGYQAPGTRGASLAQGKETIKIHGQEVPIRAQVKNLDIFSAHADQAELLQWLSQMPQSPHKIFLVHGEAESSLALQNEIQKVGPKTKIFRPRLGDIAEI